MRAYIVDKNLARLGGLVSVIRALWANIIRAVKWRLHDSARECIHQNPGVARRTGESGFDRQRIATKIGIGFVGLVARIRDMRLLVLRAATDFGHNSACVSF